MLLVNEQCTTCNYGHTWKGVTLTEAAAKKILSLMNKEKEKMDGVRIDIKHAGCAGFKYIINFVQKPNLEDIELSHLGVKIFISCEAMPFIDGTQLDYINEGSINHIFKFNNPNAQHTCGCGESFSIESLKI